MYGKQEVKAFLEERGIDHRWVEHEAVYTIEDMQRLGLEKEHEIAKNLFLRDQKGKRHLLVVIRSDKQANLKELGEKLGVGKLSFASEERLEKYMKLKKGAVTPLGILNDTDHTVEVYLDQDLMQMPCIGVHPNENTASVYLAPEALLQILQEQGNPIEIVSF